EVMAFDTRHGQGAARLGKALNHLSTGSQGSAAAFPAGPGTRRMHLADFIVPSQPAIIGRYHVMTLILGDQRLIVFPVVWKGPAGALLVEPADILIATQKDAAQNHAADPLRM